MTQIDYSAERVLTQLSRTLRNNGVTLGFAIMSNDALGGSSSSMWDSIPP